MKKVISLFMLMAFVSMSYAQLIAIMGENSTDITTCDTYVYDSGGENGNYSPGEDLWLTIHPVSGSGAVSIIFDHFDVAVTDTLYIYNGLDPNNENIPFSIGSLATNWVNNSNNFVQGDMQVAATIQNPTGAITLHFVSAPNSTCGSGFKLHVSCIEPCQRLYANIDFANSSPTPHLDIDLNDGYYYVDFCPGDTVHIATYPTYPDNDFSYHQDPSTTYFDWTYGQSGYGQTDLYYLFEEGHGYDLTLSLRDQHNGVACYGQTPVSIRVRGSKDPFVGTSPLPDVCQGTEIPLLIGMNGAANIMVESVDNMVESVDNGQVSRLRVDSTVFIPDGPNCANTLNSMRCFGSAVNFTAFPPGAVVTSASDILAVRINMEHSYIGDVSIRLKCPNGNSATIMEQPVSTNGGKYFGEGQQGRRRRGGVNEVDKT